EEKFIGEILKLTPELKDKIDALITQCTTINTSERASTVKANLKKEGILSSTKNLIKVTINKIKSIISTKWLDNYDAKLDAIKKEMESSDVKSESI
ncbi:hypothetical protein ABK046_45330, partial [Streptomyces caeruleatus]